jgi:hypothetical protein
MQYNMPRVIMWIENRSVHFYPTLDYQQLMMSPWSEYAMAHLTMLQGSDRLVKPCGVVRFPSKHHRGFPCVHPCRYI